jgi:hypothetical protein
MTSNNMLILIAKEFITFSILPPVVGSIQNQTLLALCIFRKQLNTRNIYSLICIHGFGSWRCLDCYWTLKLEEVMQILRILAGSNIRGDELSSIPHFQLFL